MSITKSQYNFAKRDSDFHNAIDDIKNAHYETERYVEELEEENEILRGMVADLLEEDIKETMRALDVSKNDFCKRTINDFIANHQKGEKNGR